VRDVLHALRRQGQASPLSSQSGGIGMAILGFSRTTKMGVSSIVGVGNKADIDEDDLLTFFEQDDNTQCIAMHLEDLKEWTRLPPKPPSASPSVSRIVLKPAQPRWAREPRARTPASRRQRQGLRRILRQSGVVRRGLNEMLGIRARTADPAYPGKGRTSSSSPAPAGSGVLLSDACVDNGTVTHVEFRPDLRRRRSGSSSRPSVQQATRWTSPAANRPRPIGTPFG